MKKYAAITLIVALIAVLAGIFLTGCEEQLPVDANGIVTKEGIKYKIDGRFATVVGYQTGAKYGKIFPTINGSDVTMIQSDAFAGSTIRELEFEVNFATLTIYPYAFANSEIREIEDFPYKNVVLQENALAGITKLEEISVRGDDTKEGCYFIDETDGSLHKTENGKDVLYLMPAARSLDSGQYTLTANVVEAGACSDNANMSTVVISDNVEFIRTGAFTGTKVNKIIFEAACEPDIEIEANAFVAHKDLMIKVPAHDVTALNSWINYSKGQLREMSVLIHPTSCSSMSNYIHGMAGVADLPVSMEGYSFTVKDANHSLVEINGKEYTVPCLVKAFGVM